ncbi:MarR family transcriptional regulator [Novosphingobium sp. PC22D]|uniref:MarR family winged helix-turn-helix transcriptional regulator n=1 Tax=Novosphingobium sp. PC22D TaxID=1962403 RepID=UPI001F0A3F6D|nr:MarR family transcriptional regulator [Novosphingobium sp. PC22D]
MGLSDELIRLNGRLKSLFADARRTVGLNDSELAVLNAVVEASRPPTVPQIGRSFGQPRQNIQRAANSLIAAGLIEPLDNPDHKRAVLLRATGEGVKIKRDLDRRADALAAEIAEPLDERSVAAAAEALRKVRQALEARLRVREDD